MKEKKINDPKVLFKKRVTSLYVEGLKCFGSMREIFLLLVAFCVVSL